MRCHRYLVLFISLAALVSCGSSDNDTGGKIPAPTFDRFAGKFKDISVIGELRRLTEVKRDMMPFFSPSGDRIYFTRLLITDPDDVDSNLADAIEDYFSINFETNQLYILKDKPEFTGISLVPADSLPSMMTETSLFGIRTNSALYFTTHSNVNSNMRIIYKQFDDSLIQLTYGSESAYLQLASPDERYLVFLYNQNHSSIVLYDNQTGDYFVIPKSEAESKRHDFAPQFSPDSKYLVFLRSGDLYIKEVVPFGDIWLLTFKNDD